MALELSNIIKDWVPNKSKVIDFGCGEGSLLKELMKNMIIKFQFILPKMGWQITINQLQKEKFMMKIELNFSIYI